MTVEEIAIIDNKEILMEIEIIQEIIIKILIMMKEEIEEILITDKEVKEVKEDREDKEEVLEVVLEEAEEVSEETITEEKDFNKIIIMETIQIIIETLTVIIMMAINSKTLKKIKIISANSMLCLI